MSNLDRLVGSLVRSEDTFGKVAMCDEAFLVEFGLSDREVETVRAGELSELVAVGAHPVSALWLSMLRHPEFAETMSAAEYFEEINVTES